jgi:hypothetical protein
VCRMHSDRFAQAQQGTPTQVLSLNAVQRRPPQQPPLSMHWEAARIPVCIRPHEMARRQRNTAPGEYLSPTSGWRACETA